MDRRPAADPTRPTSPLAPDELQRTRNRLDRALANACLLHETWPARIAVGIYAALDFAAAEPDAARALYATATDPETEPIFAATLERLTQMLSREAPHLDGRPAPDPRRAVLLIARLAVLQIEADRPEHAAELAPALALFTLAPYIGFEAAKDFAARRPRPFAPAPSPQLR